MTLLPEGQLYIDGILRDAAGGAKYEDINPWTGEVIAYAADGSPADMDEAITAAGRASIAVTPLGRTGQPRETDILVDGGTIAGSPRLAGS